MTTELRAEPVPQAAAPPPAIEVRGLRMSYGSRQVLRGVDFEVRAGEVFCLLGPNGAGKPVTELRRSFSR
jgi:ABC-2 type transport system ATP-binding protein